MRGPKVEDVAGRVDEALRALDLSARVQPGDRVAVTAGSRGIANIAIATRATVEHVRSLGAEPFIVPAMGSHGGGTPEGQTALLATLGITEESCGCPIDARMDVVMLAESKLGFPVLYAAAAAEADHVVIVNRVKTHTRFAGAVESGLAKMAAIGLGKVEGAALYHQATFELGWMDVIDEVLPIVVDRGHVVAGVALVERGDEQTARVEAIPGEAIRDVEPQLLDDANRWMARLPFSDIDLLVIDEVGKNISGTGLDPTVVGRKDALHVADPHGDVRVRYIAARALTEETHGNAVGIGFAELCRSRVVREMDVAVTRLNALTAGNLPAAMVPVDYETDAEIIDVVLPLLGLRSPSEARVMWIRSTLDIEVVACSEALLEEARLRDDIHVLGDVWPLPLGSDGNLPDLLPLPG
ncbi:MAG TPA: lactate racemase domain-containing protein [Acidimicrobiales bacterium]|nr:lactate racemase domain-containing protein [Acidimicrobiales bacterium]